MATEIILKTWVCPNCGYHQDFEPAYGSLCRSCKGASLIKEEDPEKKAVASIIDNAGIIKELSEPENADLTPTEKVEYVAQREEDKQVAIEEMTLLEDN